MTIWRNPSNIYFEQLCDYDFDTVWSWKHIINIKVTSKSKFALLLASYAKLVNTLWTQENVTKFLSCQIITEIKKN